MESVEENKIVYTNKIFVGNVPFQCTKDEFMKCFETMEGFVDADIIRRFRSKLSRGFGFVVFDNEDSAKKLLESEPIKLRDRELRFSVYSVEKNNKFSKPDHQVFIKDLEEGETSDDLREKLNCYNDIISCIVSSRNGKTYGVVGFKTQESYQDLLDRCSRSDVELNVTPYRRKVTHSRRINDPQSAYREGFRAGHTIGFKEGMLEATNCNSA